MNMFPPSLSRLVRGLSTVAALATVALIGPRAGAITAPNVSLIDENANSIRYQQEVSPKDYRQRLSVWYFGAAT